MSQKTVWPTLRDFLGMSDEELDAVDPVVMNLVIAKGIPSLAHLDIDKYVRQVDRWADDLRRRTPRCERSFHHFPKKWNNDIILFRLGLVCWYLDVQQGIAYKEDHRNRRQVMYTDPSDLFLNGILDTRRGTCGNMSLLQVVMGRRVGLPVSLACVGSHFVCRYDDGEVTRNIETTDTGRGGFASPTDEQILKAQKLPEKAQSCGSDLQSATPRKMLGLFLALRARHFDNIHRLAEAEPDYLLARYLFPENRYLYISQNQASVQLSMDLFEEGEKGHPVELAAWLREVVLRAPWESRGSYRPPLKKRIPTTKKQENGHVRSVETLARNVFVGADIDPNGKR